MPDETLADELRAVGRGLDVPPPPDPAAMAGTVRRRIVPPPRRATAAWRGLTAAAGAVVVVVAVLLAGSTQVRAAVVDFFRFAGVIVERGEPAAPSTAQGPSGGGPEAVLADVAAAERLVGFPVLVPAALGPPDEVSVLDERVVSMTYQGRGVRLDQFAGRVDPAFAKTLPPQNEVTWVRVGDVEGLWVRGPHELVYVDRDGRRHTESARQASDTLLWQLGDVTFRLEGTFTTDEAVAIAETVR